MKPLALAFWLGASPAFAQLRTLPPGGTLGPPLSLPALPPLSGAPVAGLAAAPAGPAPLPPARLILERAQLRGVSLAALGTAIRHSHTPLEAALNLRELGLLSPREADLRGPGRRARFEAALHSLWDGTAPHVEPEHRVEDGWPLPAVSVSAGGVRWRIHGAEHGAGYLGVWLPARARPVRELAGALRERGRALYSEEHFPAMHGYDHGRELVISPVRDGGEVRVRDLPNRRGLRPLWAAGALRVGLSGSLAVSLGLLLHDPAQPWAWAAAAGAGLLNWGSVRMTPLYRRLRLHALAWRARGSGAEDLAAQLARTAESAHGFGWDLRRVLAASLPMPLKVHERRLPWRQSLGMAASLLRDASARGLREAHVLVGYNHVSELAWALRHGSPDIETALPEVPKAQDR